MDSLVDILLRNDIESWHLICYVVARLSEKTGFASITRVNSILGNLQLNYQWDPLLFQIGILRYHEPTNKGTIELRPIGRKYAEEFLSLALEVAPIALQRANEVIEQVKKQPFEGWASRPSAKRRLLRAPRILLCDVGKEHNRLPAVIPLLKKMPPYSHAYLFFNGGGSEVSGNVTKEVLLSNKIALSASLVHTDVFDPDQSLRDLRSVLREHGPLCNIDVLMIGMSRINIVTTLAVLKEYYRQFVNEFDEIVETNWFWAEPISYGDNPGEFDEIISMGPKLKNPKSLFVPSGFDIKRIRAVVAEVEPAVSYITTPSNPNQEQANKRSRQNAAQIRGEFPNVEIYSGIDYSRPYSVYRLLQFYRPEVVSPLGSRPVGLATSVYYAETRSNGGNCTLVYARQNYDRNEKFSNGARVGFQEKVFFGPGGLVKLDQ
jgi:hypothetical protein